jgi:Xaa-Pro aminopeptidase
MWPVNGKYSPAQRELLQFVLDYRNVVLKLLRPGITKAIYEQAHTAMEPVLQRTKFSKPVYEQAARKMVATGGGTLSHPVGLAVHDDGPYNRDVLKVGHVFSIDPQLWVPEENLYIRYEDVIVITETGYENFTEFLPTELNDLEKLVGQGGIGLKLQPAPDQELRKRK